jgi:Holliday junction resolvasome RuvABC endonuclease subunit
MTIVGLDLSLARTGMAVCAENGIISFSIVPTKEMSVTERIMFITQNVLRHINADCRVFMENHSFGSQGQGVRQLAELTGAIKHKLLQMNASFVVVAPLTLKKWATGFGGSSKNPVDKCLVLHRIALKTGMEPQNADEADATTLADFGWHVLNPESPRRELLQYEKETIAAFVAPKVKKPRKRKEG